MTDLARRTLVALAGAPALLLMATSEPTRILLALLVQVLALREWRTLSAAHEAYLSPLPLLIAVAGLNSAVLWWPAPRALAGAAISLALLLLWELFRKQRAPLKNLGSAALFLAYVCLPLSLWAALDRTPSALRFTPAGALVSLFVATWIADSAAYFAGRAVGRRKLFVAASPNKTVEGFVAGIAGAALAYSLLALGRGVSPRFADGVALTLIVGLIGQAGDLLESLMKREVNRKDTARILPGHGGILDRFDSLLLSTPAFYAYLVFTG